VETQDHRECTEELTKERHG
jgi:hypothetical protein